MAAMLLGMLWFAPDDTGTAGTKSETPPSPSASTSASPTASPVPQDDDGEDD